MNHWKETAEILSRLAELTGGGAAGGARHGRAHRRLRLSPARRQVPHRRDGRHPGQRQRRLSGGRRARGGPGGPGDGEAEPAALQHRRRRGRRLGARAGLQRPGGRLRAAGHRGAPGGAGGPLRELLAGDAPSLATVVDGDDPARSCGGPERGSHGSLGSRISTRWPWRRPAASCRRPFGVQTIGGRAVFFEVLPPPPHLIVCGAGDDARPLVAYAADAGFRVTVVDHRPALLEPGLVPAGVAAAPGPSGGPGLALPPPSARWRW